MSKSAPILVCSEQQRAEIVDLASSQTEDARIVERAKMVLGCLDGKPMVRIASEMGVRPNTVIVWRKRFMQYGIAGLRDLPRSGKPALYGAEFRRQVLELLETPPPKGQDCWDGPSVAKRLKVSDDAVWRLLRKERICLSRQRSWSISTDPEFVAKAADIVGLYLSPPENALVICVVEKPGIQALERSTGYVQTTDGKVARGYKNTYKHHGTLKLFAALEGAAGSARGKETEQKRRVEFMAFMEELLEDYPEDNEIHVIADNRRIQKKNNECIRKHPNVHFHFTPTSASWLNTVDIWFAIFSRKALRGADFKNNAQLRTAIEAYLEACSETTKPFVWRKQKEKSSQLRSTIVNLHN